MRRCSDDPGGSRHLPLVLASASPRRRELLRLLRVRFDVVPPELNEKRLQGERPSAFVTRIAREKAQWVAARCPGRWVLGADTVVVLGGDILGKPADAREAQAMLRLLSGRTHSVLTAVALVTPGGGLDEDVAETRVRFRLLAEEEIAAYVAAGEPLDKAGAYALQGDGGSFVEAIEGDASTVIGLPLGRVARLLAARGWPVVC